MSVVTATQPPLLRHLDQTSSTTLVNLRKRPLSVLFAIAFLISPVAGLWIVTPMVVSYGEPQRWLARASQSWWRSWVMSVRALRGHHGDCGACHGVGGVQHRGQSRCRGSAMGWSRWPVPWAAGSPALSAQVGDRHPDRHRRPGPHLAEPHRTGAPHRLADRPGGRGPVSNANGYPARGPELSRGLVALAGEGRGTGRRTPAATGRGEGSPSQETASQFPSSVDVQGFR